MTSKKTTRRALFSSMISLILCCAMLIGTTFAWFTDSVTSANNIIKSGKLDVEMFYTDDLNTPADDWNDASTGAIFNYQFWEPGYSDAKYVKIENVGNLAFKYQLNIIPAALAAEGEANLADVIDVYFGIVDESFTAPTEFSPEMTGLKNVGTLSDLMADPDGIAYGALLPEEGANDVAPPEGMTEEEFEAFAQTGSVTACIILHMQEEAGNEYQELSVGEGFFVQLLATQFTYEEDSFDNQYDKDAKYEEITIKTPTALVKNSGEYRFADNGADRGENAYYTVPAGDYTDAPFFSQEFAANNVFDGSGATFANVQVLANYCTEKGDVFEVKNVKSEGTLTVSSYGGTVIINNCEVKAIKVDRASVIVIKNSTINGYGENRNGDNGGYGMYIIPSGDYKLTVTDNVINNCDMHCIAIQAGGAGDIEVSGNTFNAWGSATNKEYRAAFKIWGDTVLAPTNMDSYNQLSGEAKALVADILANNTFPADLTAIGGTGTQVIFDFYDAAFSNPNE